jgi:hypothetical protein
MHSSIENAANQNRKQPLVDIRCGNFRRESSDVTFSVIKEQHSVNSVKFLLPIKMTDVKYLPPSDSAFLCLDHQTEEERRTIWRNTAASWKDCLDLATYLTESQYLTTVPLAENGGMTTWISVDKRLPPDHRFILCSCESFRKRWIASDAAGKAEENIVHGIASVFCPPEYRGKGYAARHMREMAQVLRKWQSDDGRPIGSVLYSDIGKIYYQKLGWIPNRTNS